MQCVFIFMKTLFIVEKNSNRQLGRRLYVKIGSSLYIWEVEIVNSHKFLNNPEETKKNMNINFKILILFIIIIFGYLGYQKVKPSLIRIIFYCVQRFINEFKFITVSLLQCLLNYEKQTTSDVLTVERLLNLPLFLLFLNS